MKVVIGVGCTVAAVFSLVLGLASIAGGAQPAASLTTPVCATTGPIRGLSTTAATNARLVVAAAQGRVGNQGAVVAIMVGVVESGLRVLGNPNVSGAESPQGSGTNADSVGIFQQRSTWGSVAQRLDPVISTGLFVTRLSADVGWQSKVPWEAAQDVQGSAFDGHPRPANHFNPIYGGNYKTSYTLAQRIVALVDKDAQSLSCGALSGGLPANTAAGSHGLPSNYVIPASATHSESKVVTFAIAQLDKPYVFGAAGPGAYDCSGLVMAAWATAGVALPHQASAQALTGTPTSAAALVPGDLVLVPGDDGTLAAPGHVGIYIGDGLVLNAADEQIGIRVQTYANFIEVGHGLSALRHVA